MGYSQLLMSRIKSILKDSDSQWSLLTVTTTHHHRSPSSQGKNRKKEIEKEIVIARYNIRAYNIYTEQIKQQILYIRDAESN